MINVKKKGGREGEEKEQLLGMSIKYGICESLVAKNTVIYQEISYWCGQQ